MIGLKGTLNVRVCPPSCTNQSKYPLTSPRPKKKPTGNRQLGRTARRVRQRAKKQSQQRLGHRWRRDRLRRKARPTHLPRRAGRLQRAQGPPRRRAARRHRPEQEAHPTPGRTVGALRRQRGGAAQQQARVAGHADKRGGQRGPADEGMGQDCELGSQGELPSHPSLYPLRPHSQSAISNTALDIHR